MKRHWILLIAVALLAAACAGTAVPPPVEPEGEDRFLIDPRTGFTPAPPPAVERRFDAAWRFVLAGNAGRTEHGSGAGLREQSSRGA